MFFCRECSADAMLEPQWPCPLPDADSLRMASSRQPVPCQSLAITTFVSLPRNINVSRRLPGGPPQSIRARFKQRSRFQHLRLDHHPDSSTQLNSSTSDSRWFGVFGVLAPAVFGFRVSTVSGFGGLAWGFRCLVSEGLGFEGERSRVYVVGFVFKNGCMSPLV